MMSNDVTSIVEKILLQIKHGFAVQKSVYELHAYISSTIRYIALKYLHNRHDAEDLVQDFWSDIYRISCGYRYNKNAWGYLCKVANNMAINRYKVLHKNAPVSIEYVKYSEEYKDDRFFIQGNRDFAKIIHIEEFLDKLPSTQRKIIQITYFENKTIREIAEELKMSKSEVHRQKQNGLQQLKAMMQEEFDI